MSVSSIPVSIKIRLWGKAAGRCQYEGCNAPLWLDTLTKTEFNKAYVAHIIADEPDGPRGVPGLSEKLCKDITNIMLMCDEHHRLIDKIDVAGHPVERLHMMKKNHEERIELQTSVLENMQSLILLYGANVGKHDSPVSFQNCVPALYPWYPASSHAIELGMKNSSFNDAEPHFWSMEREHLQRQFQSLVKSRLAQAQIPHLSVFGMAPIPLLIELGRLLSDIPAAEVYQLHREPPVWKWQSTKADEFIVKKPDRFEGEPVLNLSISATIVESRISSIISEKHSIWTITVPEPNNDCLKIKNQLHSFRDILRKLLNQIKASHKENGVLHIFPAIPVSIAIEIGRVWMPKADLRLRIYDENKTHGGFRHVFDIN
jgi:hypothetical protein